MFRKTYLTKEEAAKGYERALSILENTGVVFQDEEAVQFFKKAGAKAEGNKIYINKAMVENALNFLGKGESPQEHCQKITATSLFGNAPLLLDEDTKTFRRPRIKDIIKMYKLNETSSLYRYANPGLIDPEDNDAQDRYLSQIAMILKYSNKPISLGIRASVAHSPKEMYIKKQSRA